MKRKRVIPISQLALASILAFVNPVFASTAGLNHRAGFPERALVVSDGGSVVAQGGMLRERERAKTREVEEELGTDKLIKLTKLTKGPNRRKREVEASKVCRTRKSRRASLCVNPFAYLFGSAIKTAA